MAPSRLLDLPVETLMMVIEELCVHCFDPVLDSPAYTRFSEHVAHRSALAALALTSKLLNTLVTPHLYHEPKGDWSLLIRTLIERPDLVPHVKSIQVGEDFPPLEFFQKPGREVALEAFHTKMEERADGAFGEYEEDEDIDDWGEEMKHDTDAAEFLIAMCPNMAHLDIGIDSLGPRFTMVGDAGLADLKHVSLSYRDTELGWNMSLISRLPRVAPNLSTLYCRAISGPADFSDKFENLTKLELYLCSIETGSLEPILRAMPRLEILDFFAGDACVSFETHLPMRELQDVLTLRTPRLKTLKVDLEIGNHENVVESRDLWTSLGGLTKLEHLEFDYRCIFPHHDAHTVTVIDGQPVVLPSHVPGRHVFADLLPSSIKTVRFEHGPVVGACGDQPAYSESVDGLLASLKYLSSVASEKFPSLRRFELVNAWKLKGDMDGIKSMMEAGGIEFVPGVHPHPGYMR